MIHLMNDTDFNPYEEEAVLQFLKDYVNKETLSIYSGTYPKYLLTAYLKLTKSVEDYRKAMSYSE